MREAGCGMTYGTLDPLLKQYPEGARLFESAGPVSDAFILSKGKIDLLNGPVGSGKTTACVKRALHAARVQQPMVRQGVRVRRYVLNVWRATYDQLWRTTIPSWKKVLNPDAGIGTFTGSNPRPGLHEIEFDDGHGFVQMVVRFLAFGDDANVDDLGGLECTDSYLNELDTLREDLFINLMGRIGRDPTRGEMGLPDKEGLVYGRIFADCNAPAPDNWVFRNFWGADKPPGYTLFRQPGGMAADAENIAAVGRQYYRDMIAANAKRSWWIKIKVDNEPGFNRETDVVYPDFEDSEHVSLTALAVEPLLPVLIGYDGGGTPAAAFLQELPGGRVQIIDEIVISRGDEIDLGEALKVKMALPRYKGCEFVFNGDPATEAGEDSTRGSFRSRLADALGLRVDVADTNDPETRHRPLREALKRRNGLTVDGVNCPTIRRAMNGTFHYHTMRGTGERKSVVKNPDSHVMEAAEYAALLLGTERARVRRTAKINARKKRKATQNQGQYNPLAAFGG